MARLKEKYKKEISLAMKDKFKYKNIMQIPKLEKIVINMGLSEALQNPKVMDVAVQELTLISGQKPSIRRARKSISNFKLRAGVPIGCMVTLRGDRMYEFFDRFVNVVLPRVRDFRGVNGKKSFDGKGNYSIGMKEQIIFPEIEYDKVDKIRGMDITFVTNADSDDEAMALLRMLGMPFKD
ncbi:MAG: 50S ribosomal protein L5 [bacterium]|nr:50S ribosomal protein L5 [bacterium]